jgi:hypothetical protein
MQHAITREESARVVRGAPGVVEAYKKLRDNEDLVVSIHTMNFTFPSRTNIPANKSWPSYIKTKI